VSALCANVGNKRFRFLRGAAVVNENARTGVKQAPMLSRVQFRAKHGHQSGFVFEV